MTKKVILIGVGIIFLIVGFVFWLYKPFSSPSSPTIAIPSPKKTLLINTLPLEERPYIILEPKGSVEPKSLGHWVTMTIDNVKNFERVEYEFEYTTGQMIQGGMGRIDFAKETPPVFKEIAFGSASKGKYKYDEGVNSGKFTFHFFVGEKEEVLRTEFNLQNNEVTEGVFNSSDGKVRLTVGKNDLEEGDFLIIASTLGLPGKVQGKVLAGPYGFYADSPKRLTNAVLIFEGVEKENVVILEWRSNWEEYKTKVGSGKASAEVDSLGTFVLVEK